MKENKSWKHTEPVSEYDVHVAVKKDETLEELDKKLAKKFRKDLEKALVVTIAVVTVLTLLYHLLN